MKPIAAMFCSIMITVMMMVTTAVFINMLEGDILPETSGWSFINDNKG
jgi:hypothetical protein